MPDGLRERPIAPEIASEAMRAHAEETNRLNRERRTSGDVDRGWLVRSLKEIVTLIEDGGGSRALVVRLRELEA